MKTHRSACARSFSRALPAALSVLYVLLSSPLSFTAAAEGPPAVLRVEEDWELMVSSPDSTTTAPQVTCATFPVSESTSLCAVFELNHQTQPSFVSGGIQLQIWEGPRLLDSRKFPRSETMASPGERVTWTQTMTLAPGAQESYLTFEIVNGQSATWGLFGGQGYLRSTVATSLQDLNDYNPRLSVLNSGVGYAANRVQSLTLREVRLVLSDGQVLRDTTVRSVYPLD